MTKNTLLNQGVAEKAEIDHLFDRLYPLYRERLIPAAPFPIHQVTQARAWRGFPCPDWDSFKEAVQAIDQIPIGLASGGIEKYCMEKPSLFPYTDGSIGMRVEWLGALVVITEAVFRVVRQGELELEELLSTLLSSRGLPPDNEPQKELLREDFRQLAARKLRGAGSEWVLAGGRIAVPMKRRPPLIAPQVVGAVVCRRLTGAKVPRGQAENLAALLSSVLLGRRVRAEDVAHWDREFFRVKIESSGQEVSLTTYLAEPLTLVPRAALDRATPRRILDAFKMPQSAFAQFAERISPIERAFTKTLRVSKPRPVSSQEVSDEMFRCQHCGQLVEKNIWEHLRVEQGLQDEEFELSEDCKQILYKSTGKVLAVAIKRDGFVVVQKRKSKWAEDRSIYEASSDED